MEKYVIDTQALIKFLNGQKVISDKIFEIKDIPELHDRLIAGTAKYLNLPLITNDPIILKSESVICIK